MIRARAFTLLEAMLAMTLLAGLTLGVFSFAANVARDRELMVRESDELRGTSRLISAIEQSFSMKTLASFIMTSAAWPRCLPLRPRRSATLRA